MSEDAFIPDVDSRVTHVIVLELLTSTDDTSNAIYGCLESDLMEHKLIRGVDFLLTRGTPTDPLKMFRESTGIMSTKQRSFMNRLLDEMRPLMGRAKAQGIDPEVWSVAENVTAVIFLEVGEHESNLRAGGPGVVTSRRAGELIDAIKSTISDLRGELNGV
jgi:hypothetical protein